MSSVAQAKAGLGIDGSSLTGRCNLQAANRRTRRLAVTLAVISRQKLSPANVLTPV
jgi:hypothetical protein